MRALVVAVGVGLLFADSPVRAEERLTLAPGLRVRVTTASSGRPLTGTIQSTDDAVLDVISEGRATRVRRDQVTRLEVGVGCKDYTVKGGIVGGLAGFAAGVAYLAGDQSCPEPHCGEWDIFMPVALGMVGTAAGAGAGWLIRPEGWTDIPLDRVRVGVGRAPHRGVEVRVSFAF